MDFPVFNEDYLCRLRDGDATVERHFVEHFGRLLRIKLRARLRWSTDEIDDVQQETFLRVLRTLRTDNGIRSPERLGPFVHSVCNNVLLETYRRQGRFDEWPENMSDPPDRAVDLEGDLLSEERQRQVRRVLASLPDKDRDLLESVFLKEQDKNEVCRRFGVDRDYLRVLLHRAKNQFRARFLGGEAGSA